MSEKLFQSSSKNQNIISKYVTETAEIRRTKGPVEDQGAEEVYKQISDNNYARRILGYVAHGIDGFDSGGVQFEDFKAFYESHPAPQDFEDISKKILRLAHNKYDDDRYQAYVDAMDAFKQAIYGEKQTKWEELKAKRQAEAASEKLSARDHLRQIGAKALAATRDVVTDTLYRQSENQPPSSQGFPHPPAAA